MSAGQSQCDQCAYADCCADITACFTSAACTSLYDCIAGCAGSPACVKACSSQYPQAQLAYQQLASCVSLRCPVCSEAGAGDPCAGGVACVTGLSCSGSWCTRSCTATSDCAGIGPGGGNYTGQPGACVHLPGGFECVPGCSTDADCSAFEGTYCEQTTSVEGVAVSVCGALPDGG